ncbi:ROK family protein [Actinomycetes bacterium M1A6_2h]
MSVTTIEPVSTRSPLRRSRARIVAPDLRLSGTPASAVMRTALLQGPVSRDVIARSSGVSTATVNRQVSALVASGLLRERADLVASGAIGRPRVPVEIDHEPYLTIGIHIGSVTTGIIASDLRGRILGAVDIATPSGTARAALETVAASAQAFASRWHRRRPLWVGVALGGRVDAAAGTADHPRLGWVGAPVGAVLGERLGLPVSVSPHVEAMAASELLLAPGKKPDSGSSLYFYARETTGVAITIDGRVHTPSGGPGSIAHLPTGSSAQCSCGRTGCLEASVSDRSVVEAARSAGVVGEGASIAAVYAAARSGSLAAHRILVERADILGRTVAVLHDLFNPDRVLLGGQAFSEYQPGLPHVGDAFARCSVLPRTDLRVSGFGSRVQEYAAATVSLSPLYSDPIGAMRKADSVLV